MSQIKVDTITNAAGTGAPSFTYGITGTAPTVQRFTSGASNYTTPANCKWIKVKMVGGGGGGASSGTSGGAGGNGFDSTFGSALIAGKGFGAASGAPSYGLGGSGGTGTITESSSVKAVLNCSGGDGAAGQYATTQGMGGNGGASALGGAGVAGFGTIAGSVGKANTGGGGGGGGNNTVGNSSGGGGGAGAYIEAIILSPSASYSYSVGAGGSAGTGGAQVGFAGGSGVIVVEEFYS